MSELMKKLNHTHQTRLLLLGDTGDCPSLLSFPGLEVKHQYSPADGQYDFIIAMVRSIAELDSVSSVVLSAAAPDALLWWAYPKQSSRKFGKCDLTRDTGWDSMTTAGYRHVRMISLDDDWSMVRQRHESSVGKTKK